MNTLPVWKLWRCELKPFQRYHWGPQI